MKLTYDILWFEDQFEALSPSIERLEEFIRGEGIIPSIEKREGISENQIYEIADQLEKNNPYDLVIFDFDMGEDSLNGIEIAKILRTNIYTDMVFYSGKKPQEISRLVYENGIQGVYVVHKVSLIDDVEPLIKDQVKKMSSLNGARGLLMSETSQFDIELRNNLVAILKESTEEKQQKILEKLQERASEKYQNKLFKIQEFSFEELILNSMIIDNDLLRKTCKDVLNDTILFNEGGKYQTTQLERNFLAHNPHEKLESGDVVVTNGKKSKQYNHEEFSRVRKEIIELKSLLNEVNA